MRFSGSPLELSWQNHPEKVISPITSSDMVCGWYLFIGTHVQPAASDWAGLHAAQKI